jgi:serine/threonine-protein kinase
VEREDLTGAVLDGRYRIIEPIAEGGMGVVYRAERVKLGRIVAVKVLHDVLPSELSSRRRFEIEAMAMAKLEHPHCAAVVDVGLHGDRPFVVMDFVSGQNLKDVISAQAPLPIPRAVELLRQILSGLAHAHELGIIHRDIKPANLVLSQKVGLGDHVKILDFGLARLGQDSSLTTGVVVGTPSYMAPEQIRGQKIDTRVDLYACGVVLFELLTGTKPFVSPKDDPIEVCTMHLTQPPPRLADRWPSIEYGELEAVVARALAKAADDRFATAAEFVAALDAIAPRRVLATPVAGVPVLATPVAGVPVLATPAPPPDLSASATLADPPPSSDASASATVLDSPASPDEPAPATLRGHTPPSPACAEPAAARPAPGEARPPVARPAAPRASRGRGLPLAAASGAVIAVVVVLAVSLRGGSSSAPDAGPPGGSASPASPSPDPAVEAALARAAELEDAGQKPAALDLVLAARKTSPDDARLAFLAGRLLFEKVYVTEGMKHLRDAIRLDPRYRTDPELIKLVLRAYITTPAAEAALATFLHDDIGDAARPYLEETAADHPNPTVRARASAELKRYSISGGSADSP